MSDPMLFSAVNGGPDNRYRLEMVFDEMAENPRSMYDTLWHLRFAGRDFIGLSDYTSKFNVKKGQSENVRDTLPRYYSDFKDELKELREKGWLVAPIHGYSHSGITISLSSKYPYNDSFDGGTVGFALLDPEDLKARHITPAQAYSTLQDEIKELDYYCQGQCFGFVLYEWGDHRDSCYGFYGNSNEVAKNSRDLFGDEFAPLFDKLGYQVIDPELAFKNCNAAMEAYAI